MTDLTAVNSDDTRNDATSDETASAHETGHHWLHTTKDILVCVKVFVICFLMISAIVHRRAKYGLCNPVTYMLLINIFVLIGLLVFEFTTKYIVGFFALVMLANYCNFMGFMIMIRHCDTPEVVDLRKHTNVYLVVMNILYAATIALAFTNKFGPYCVASRLYPACMNFTNGLFIINCMYHHYMHANNYWLEWEKDKKIIVLIEEKG